MITKDAIEIVAFIKGWQCGIRTTPEKDRTDRQNLRLFETRNVS